MNQPLINHQSLLAEQVILNEIQTNHACYEAMLKIQRWKFILQNPGIADHSPEEASELIRSAFFSFVPVITLLAELQHYTWTEN